jgi:hypothetical protein
MRPLGLARAAAEAEVLRLRRRLRRTIIRAVYALIGAIFAFATLCMAHAAVFMALRHSLGPTGSALIVLGADLTIAAICVVLASVSSPDRIELEAQQVRERAREELEEMAAAASFTAPAIWLVGKPRLLAAALAFLIPRLRAHSNAKGWLAVPTDTAKGVPSAPPRMR